MDAGQVSERDRQVMAVLANTPFADADEVAVFAGLQAEQVVKSLDSCRGNSFVDFVGFRRSDVAYTRRWCLIGQGVKVLSGLEGATPEEYLREKPVSIEWKRSLLRRLESLDLLYRLLATVAKLDGATPEWVWHRAGIFDATMRLRNGKAFALMRLGTTLSWKATKGRIGTLYKQQGRREAPPALIVVPTDIEALRISRFMARRAINMYLVSEERLDCMQIGGALWRKGGYPAPSVTLEQVLSDTYARRRMSRAQTYRHKTLPGDDIRERINPAYLVASQLKAKEKRILRLLYDWPLIKNDQLAAILGISNGRLKEPRATLVRHDLLHVVQIGKSHKERVSTGYRSVLSDAGRRSLAWTDRRDLSELAKHWRITPDSEGHPKPKIKDYRLDGTKLKMLARELKHTDGVSEFTAMMMTEARKHSRYEVVSVLPPHRWDRTFRFNGKRATIKPDATYIVNCGDNREACFLEYERRASIPARMKPKVEAYRKYYGSMATRVDFGRRRPRTLFVFEDEAQAGRFVGAVLRGMRNENPLFVSSMDVLREKGIFGNAWLFPWDLDLGRVQFAMFRGVRRGS